MLIWHCGNLRDLVHEVFPIAQWSFPLSSSIINRCIIAVYIKKWSRTRLVSYFHRETSIFRKRAILVTTWLALFVNRYCHCHAQKVNRPHIADHFVKNSFEFVSGPFFTSRHLTIISLITNQIRLGDRAICILFNCEIREILRSFYLPHLKALVK